ncbi:hypothetical protein K60_005840 [Mycobacterium tuberculosis variant bovis BCG str. Korea 1168P]|uniref:Uncharacterized protein n=1 Tax=Mycobacterium tuberculosis (strain CDC 1551 / Oshkosh) TaxID=83331 RepID=Q8VKJ1_MYCTO|nr:hypothetical protein MT0576 [Mycobacterium tuberculosis CDC1551]AGE66494.1 hypothetical protein K60_005840 [Mycobacterium tuberculosis variant bovis BCG str. Korea 1168P]AHM06255.1 hypothetical protein BCGT_0334 [Mycobacterium tuberculosis variant bovis BCG str. ATCC 35743]AKO23523.1 hypothetical protein GS11_0597 [Mycobacterium tuberculosis variant bovis BCG]AKR00137.1 hypothetical protein Mb1595_p0614 [Mycobacterium tuberculosis variant bovis]EFD45879.1 predicted protein [Mycobacterium tu
MRRLNKAFGGFFRPPQTAKPAVKVGYPEHRRHICTASAASSAPASPGRRPG